MPFSLTAAGGYAIGGALAAVAALRGGKAVHPDGVVHGARLVVDGAAHAPRGSALLGTAGEHQAIVRFSRSLGVPRPIPDLLGAAVRIVDAYGPDQHQDLLMVSSVDLPVLHHVFLPATDVQQRPYSSSLPYRAGDETFLVGLVPDPLQHMVFDLAVAPLRGRFRRVAKLHVEQRLPHGLDALRFNPIEHTGGGLEPTGVLNRLRAYAYPMSQAAWTRRIAA